MVKGKTKSGIKYQIDERVKDDARVLYYMTKLQSFAKEEASAEVIQNAGQAVFKLLELIFGSDEGVIAFMNEVAAHNNDLCDTNTMLKEILDIFEGIKAKNS